MLTPHEESQPEKPAAPPTVDATAGVERLVEPVERVMLAFRAEDEPALAIALHSLSAQARRDAVPVERIIILLKALWHASPMERPSRGRPSGDQLARLVSACIVSYYED